MGSFQSAYSQKRLKAIAKAINDWLAGLSKPRQKNAEAQLGVEYNLISKWARASFCPRPDKMLRLWKVTGNRVFLLLPEERDVFLRRNFSLPDLEEFPCGKPEDTPDMEEALPKRRTAGCLSAYRDDRKKEITAAVRDWRATLRGPGLKSDIAADMLQVAPRTVGKWIAGEISPGPLYMHQLWVLTGKPVFLLRQEEKDIFLARRQEIPKDYPLYEEYEERHLSAKKLPEKRAADSADRGTVESERSIEAFEQIPDKQVIINAIIGLNIACSIVCDLFGRYKDVVLPENQRRRVAEIIRRLVASLGISEKDFLPKQPMEETDPTTKRRMDKLFSTLTQQPQA